VSRGFKPIHPDDVLLTKLFAPHVPMTVKREKFTLNGNTYHSLDLAEYHNRQVVVAYDIHDPHTVIVFDTDENYICEAKWQGNRVHARPVSSVERAQLQRHDRRLKNKEKQIDLINAETDRKNIEIKASHKEIDQETADYERREEKKRQDMLAAPKYFADEHEVYDDIRERQRQGQASAYEIQWADDKDASYTGKGPVGLYQTDRYCEGRFRDKGGDHSGDR